MFYPSNCSPEYRDGETCIMIDTRPLGLPSRQGLLAKLTVLAQTAHTTPSSTASLQLTQDQGRSIKVISTQPGIALTDYACSPDPVLACVLSGPQHRETWTSAQSFTLPFSTGALILLLLEVASPIAPTAGFELRSSLYLLSVDITRMSHLWVLTLFSPLLLWDKQLEGKGAYFDSQFVAFWMRMVHTGS